jgi:hypothetical protein
MKKIIVCNALAFVLIACSDSGNRSKTEDPSGGVVDTSVIGSDNPNPPPDTAGATNKVDSIKNK